MLNPYFRFRKKIREWSDQSLIKTVCEEYKIRLGSPIDAADATVFKDVFLHKTYADYFPFYHTTTIVDIGAHKGFFTLFAALNAGPGSRLFALEPARENFTALRKNLSVNGLDLSDQKTAGDSDHGLVMDGFADKRVTALNCGLSDRSGVVDLFLGNAENHSLFPPAENAPRQAAARATERVEMLSLQDLLEKHGIATIDFLKMDCEGAEYQILFTADAGTLGKIKTISMEFHDLKKPDGNGLAMVRFLQGHGFTIVKFQHETTYMNLNTGKLIATRLG